MKVTKDKSFCLAVGDKVKIDSDSVYEITAIYNQPERNPDEPLFFDLKASGQTADRMRDELLQVIKKNPTCSSLLDRLDSNEYLMIRDQEQQWMWTRQAELVAYGGSAK